MHRSVDGQTPPVSLTLNHLPFQGRRGRFAPACTIHPTALLRKRAGRLLVDPYRTVLNSSRSALSGGTAARAAGSRPYSGCVKMAAVCEKIHMNQKIRDILLLKRRVGKWRNSP